MALAPLQTSGLGVPWDFGTKKRETGMAMRGAEIRHPLGKRQSMWLRNVRFWNVAEVEEDSTAGQCLTTGSRGDEEVPVYRFCWSPCVNTPTVADSKPPM